MKQEMITIPKSEYENLLEEVGALRNSKLYQRLLEFEKNILSGKKLTREDLGF